MRDGWIAAMSLVGSVSIIFLGWLIGGFGEKAGQISFVAAYLFSVLFIVTGAFAMAGVWKRSSNAVCGFAVMFAGVTYSAGIQALGEWPMNGLYFLIVFVFLYVLLLRTGLVELELGRETKAVEAPPNEYEIKNLAAKKAELTRKKATGK